MAPFSTTRYHSWAPPSDSIVNGFGCIRYRFRVNHYVLSVLLMNYYLKLLLKNSSLHILQQVLVLLNLPLSLLEANIFTCVIQLANESVNVCRYATLRTEETF